MNKTAYPNKMLILIFSLLGVCGMSQSFFFPPPGFCVTTEESLECICKNRENLTISTNLNFGIRWIKVEDCGIVTIPHGAITNLQLESFIMTDLDQLEIKAFALAGVQTINLFKIENIRNFKVRQHGFVGLYMVTSVIIKNVSANSLTVESFTGASNINNFLIENSNFGEVLESAFNVTNVTTFTFSNCKFRSFKNMSFAIHNGESVQFDNCNIEETVSNSFITDFVTSLSFMNCSFGILASAFVSTMSLESFSFQDCSVEELETDAFAFVNATDKITFTHNTIKIADEYSLIPSTGTYFSSRVEIENCCNSLTCDCNIFWLFEPSEEGAYDSLLENSYCIGKPETNLSNLMPVFDSKEKCKTLELKVLNPEAKPSTTNETSAQSKVFEFKLIFLFILMGLSVLIF